MARRSRRSSTTTEALRARRAERRDLPGVADLLEPQRVGAVLRARVGRHRRGGGRAVDRDLLDLQLERVGVAQRVVEGLLAGALRGGLDLGDQRRREEVLADLARVALAAGLLEVLDGLRDRLLL